MINKMSKESNLREQIKNMEEGYESIKHRHKKEKRELISEIVNDIDDVLRLGRPYLKDIKKKWEEK